jgi:hypothetical protein
MASSAWSRMTTRVHSTTLRRGVLRAAFYLAVAFVAAIATAAVVHVLARGLGKGLGVTDGTDATGFGPAANGPEREMVFVFIGSPTCAWSDPPVLREVVGEIDAALALRASEWGYAFSSVGVAQSQSATDGLKYLSRVGRFDEVTAGRSWRNTGLIRYVYRDFRGIPMTPQVLVLDLDLLFEAGGREELLVRKVGLSSIDAWMRAGAPVPPP